MPRLHSVLLSLTLATPAFADLRVTNTLADKVRVEVTQPNGKVNKSNLSGANPAAESATFLFAPGPKTVPVAVFDGADALLWKGTAGVNDELVLVRAAKGVKGVHAGIYGGTEGPRAAVFLNATGEALTIDLEGGNGLGAHRGIKPGDAFDLKKAVKLDPREASFSVSGKNAAGEAVDFENARVTPHRFYVIYKNAGGMVKLLMAGTITPDAK